MHIFVGKSFFEEKKSSSIFNGNENHINLREEKLKTADGDISCHLVASQ